MPNYWDEERCNFEKAGHGFLNAHENYYWKLPPFQRDEELSKKFNAVISENPPVNLVLSHKLSLTNSILCSAVAYEMRQREIKYIWLETRWVKDFGVQPLYDRVVDENYETEWLIERLGGRIVFPLYNTAEPGGEKEHGPACHAIEKMCRQSGLVGEITLRPYFEVKEKLPKDLPPEYVAIQGVGSAGAAVPMPTKDWYHDRFQTVVNRTRVNLPVVQVGSGPEPALAGAIDLRGKLSVAQTAAVLKNAHAYVGQSGGLMHLARAVDCPAVIIYGGREKPWQTGYDCNRNLTGEVPCSPCWLTRNCPHNMACMEHIYALEVLDALDDILNHPPARPLPAQRVVIPDA